MNEEKNELFEGLLRFIKLTVFQNENRSLILSFNFFPMMISPSHLTTNSVGAFEIIP